MMTGWCFEVRGNAFTAQKTLINTLNTWPKTYSAIDGRPIALKIEANIEDAAVRQEQKEMSSRLKQNAMSHPLLMEALELFDGRVVDIKVP